MQKIYIKKLSLLIAVFFICLIGLFIYPLLPLNKPVISNSVKSAFILGKPSSPAIVVSQLKRQLKLPNSNMQLRLAYHYRQIINGKAISSLATNGYYEITYDKKLISLLDDIILGHVLHNKILLLEGETTGNFLRKIYKSRSLSLNNFPIPHSSDSPLINGFKHPIIPDIPQDIQNEIKKRLAISFPSIEGAFLADTYVYKKGVSAMVLLQNSHAQLVKRLNKLWNERDKSMPYKTAYEALIMASIIEKETAKDYERPIIASVFINRLKKGMRLQTDPTVIYGLGEKYRGNITKRDLMTKTPYNTYRKSGLPPTPIGNVGDAALKAAFFPDSTDYLYFVAKGDGTHHFSKNLKEHNKAVRKYQINRSSRYRSF